VAGVLEASQRPNEPWATTTLRASERIRPASINYDYAGQDPINNYDLAGTCNKWFDPFCPQFWSMPSLSWWEQQAAIVSIGIATDGIGFELEAAEFGADAAVEAPTELTGFTKHGLDSVISHDGVGVSNRALLDTLKNPLRVIRQVSSDGKVDFLYKGRYVDVSLNSAGKVITAWARSRAGWRSP
jgi:hypothetical protein